MTEHKSIDEDRDESFQRTDDEQYRPALHRYLTRVLRDAEEAQDLAQEAYVRLLQHSDARTPIRNRAAYLFRIATNLVYEFRFKSGSGPVTYDSELVDERAQVTADTAGADPGHRLTNEEQLARVLTQIPRAYRTVLLLHKRDGFSYTEIAERLNLTRETVKKYMVRALAYGRAAKWE